MTTKTTPTIRQFLNDVRGALGDASGEAHAVAARYLHTGKNPLSQPDFLRSCQHVAGVAVRAMAAADVMGRASTIRRVAVASIREHVPVLAKASDVPGVSDLYAWPLDAAIDYLKRLTPSGAGVTSRDIPEVYEAYQFRMAPGIAEDIVGAVQNHLLGAIEAGEGLRDFQVYLRNLTGGGITDRYAETLFRTETNRAMNAGRRQELEDNADLHRHVPGLQYHSLRDPDTRPNHRVHFGRIWGTGSDAWKVLLPPNGWNCRCGFFLVTRRRAIQLGRIDADGQLIEDAWPVPENEMPDPGFDVSPAWDIYNATS